MGPADAANWKLAVAMVASGVLLSGADLAYSGSDSTAKVKVEEAVFSIPDSG